MGKKWPEFKREPEYLIRDRVVRWARARGWLHRRFAFIPGAEVGWPDDMFIHPGVPAVFALIEFKSGPAANGRRKWPDDIQIVKLRELQNAGVYADWFDDSDTAIEFLRAVVEALTVYGARGRLSVQSLCRWPTFAPRREENLDSAGGVPTPAK